MSLLSRRARPAGRSALSLTVLSGALLLPWLSTPAGAQPSGASPVVDEQRTDSPSTRTPGVASVSLDGVAELAIADVAADPRTSGLTAFTAVGLSWSDPDSHAHVDVLVRTRSVDAPAGAWSAWTLVPHAEDHGPDSSSEEEAGVRGGTEPLIVPSSSGIQARVRLEGATPEDLRLDLVDGDAAALRSRSRASTAAIDVGGVSIRPRSAWGANESLKTCCLDYGEVEAGFVHHTVTLNGYSRAEVPGILRSIYAFHVNSRGYRDIGYNFLVDRFGRVWEGRAGGVERAVVGAHTFGYNHVAFAASAIGTYSGAAPSPAMLDAFTELFAWKLGMHGVDPLASIRLEGRQVRTVSGHRDVNSTECPGGRLYDELPQLRQRVDRAMGGLPVDPAPSRTGWQYGDEKGVRLSSKKDKRREWTLTVRQRCFDGPLRTLSGVARRGERLRIEWDGRDGTGALVPPGSYDLQVTGQLAGKAFPDATIEISVSGGPGAPAPFCPPRVGGVQVAGGLQRTQVGWAPVAHPDLAGYVVARHAPGTPVPRDQPTLPPGATTTQLAGLKGGKDYAVSVLAVDEDGNLSDPRTVRLRGTAWSFDPPGVASYDSPTRMPATLTRSGAPRGDVAVLVRTRPVDGGPWSLIRGNRTDASGRTIPRLRLTEATEVQLVYTGGERTTGVRSRVVQVGVQPRIEAVWPGRVLAPGEDLRVDVRVAPGDRPSVQLQEQRGSTWHTVDDRSTNAAGAVVLTHSQPERGGHEYRIRVPATPGLSTVASQPRTVDVVEVFRRPGDGVFTLTGRGYGHGIGLSQWGTRQAAEEGAAMPRILRFYYPGTTLARPVDASSSASGQPAVRVQLQRHTSPSLVVAAEPGLRVTFTTRRGAVRKVELPRTVEGCAARQWRARAFSGGTAVQAQCGDRWLAWRSVKRMARTAPVTFAAADGVTGVARGATGAPGDERAGYRGALRASRVGGLFQVVNVVPIEAYLRGVVPHEIPPSWPRTALRAQAVVARTYALHERAQQPGARFHLYDSTQSQVYRPAATYDRRWRPIGTGEDLRTDEAVASTAGMVLEYEGAPAFTQYSSSNGGATAAGPKPYLRAKVDPWDERSKANPRRRWDVDRAAATLEQAYPTLGRLRQLRVSERSEVGRWGGRVLGLELVGERGRVQVAGDSRVRQALGTPSSYLTVR